MTEATESDFRREQGDLFSLLGVGESEVTVGKATSSPKSPGSVSPAVWFEFKFPQFDLNLNFPQYILLDDLSIKH